MCNNLFNVIVLKSGQYINAEAYILTDWIDNVMKDNEKTKALKIGLTCVITYVSSYFMRNVLGVLTPQMLQTGEFSKELLGMLSSAYMFFYAIGQLSNGFIGDQLCSKHMIVTGLVLTGISSILFPLINNFALSIICFGVFGYGLSMLRGPMMKMISENTKEKYARIICAFFSSAGFIGAFVAGIFAAVFRWDSAFYVAGSACLLIAFVSYAVISKMERKKMIIYNTSSNQMDKYNFLGVFKADKFFFYIIISMIGEITTTSINFWIPTYLTENLGFDINSANIIFVVKNALRAVSPFIAVAIYEKNKDEMKILKYSFLFSAALMFSMIFIKNAIVNVFVFLISLIIVGFATAVLWSIYIPSLKKFGKVSSGNGILDSSGYIGAASANMAFAFMTDKIGWNGIIVLWSGIIFFGFIVSYIQFINDKSKKSNV